MKPSTVKRWQDIERSDARPDASPDALLTTAEVARMLGISKWQLAFWRMRGGQGGPAFIKVGRMVRYQRRDVLSFVRKHRRAPLEKAQ